MESDSIHAVDHEEPHGAGIRAEGQSEADIASGFFGRGRGRPLVMGSVKENVGTGKAVAYLSCLVEVCSSDPMK
jgi:acyl transferase domain-containing protein